MNFDRSIRLLSCVALSITAALGSGCGKNQILRDVSAKTQQSEAGHVSVEITSVWDTGNIRVPAVTLPIPDPNHPSITIGSVSLKEVFPSGAEISVGLDLTELADVDSDDALLPNGTTIPIGGLGDTPVIGLKVGDTAARAYFALGSGVALMGFAIPIREFDGLGRSMGRSNAFIPFQFGDVRGTGGLFSSPDSGQTGPGLFVDIGPLLQSLAKPKPPSVEGIGSTKGALSSGAPDNGVEQVLAAMNRGQQQASPHFYERKLSRRADENMKRGLYELHRRGTSIHPR